MLNEDAIRSGFSLERTKEERTKEKTDAVPTLHLDRLRTRFYPLSLVALSLGTDVPRRFRIYIHIKKRKPAKLPWLDPVEARLQIVPATYIAICLRRTSWPMP